MKLKVFRVMRGLSQQEMAARVGYERAYYGHIERGFMDGSAAFWDKLQNAFRLTDDDVKGLQEID